MRLLHFADLHLGVETYGSIDPQTGLSSRVGDFLARLDQIVEHAINQRFDAVLFAGDAFKTRDPNPTVQREFAKRILRLSRAEVPIALLTGNHDMPNAATRATASEIYRVLEIPGVHVCRHVETINLATRSGTLQVVTVPWFTRSAFLANEELRLLDDDELTRQIGRVYSGAVGREIEKLDRAVPATLLAHVSVIGATLGHEQSIMLGQDVAVGLDELHASAFDYIALGHIHKHQVVGVHPPAIYAGSPERIDFGEEREAKGFVDVKIEIDGDRRITTPEFVELPARRFTTLRIDAAGDAPMAEVERRIQAERGRISEAIVRCYVDVDPGRERAVAGNEVRRLLASHGAAHIAQVVIESETARRTRWDIGDAGMRDSESMLRRWVEMKNYDPELAKRVLERGLQLIAKLRQQAEEGS